MNPLTTAAAEEIWQVLVEECGAKNDHGFVYHQTNEVVNEWRFMGNLGFGGKFWRNVTYRFDGSWGEAWYVNCYPEDETPALSAVINRANDRLNDLLTKHIL